MFDVIMVIKSGYIALLQNGFLNSFDGSAQYFMDVEAFYVCIPFIVQVFGFKENSIRNDVL